jgi:hypothetical protein
MGIPLTLAELGLGAATGLPEAISFVRPLNEADLAVLVTGHRPEPLPSGIVTRLRANHHTAARLLARGKPTVEVALITGYTGARINQLLHDPAFKELLSYYESMQQELQLDLRQALADLSWDALGELRGRLETEPGKLTAREVLEIMNSAADRSGHGPSSSATLNVNLTEEMLLAIKLEVDSRQNGTITDRGSRLIEGAAIEREPERPSPDTGPALGTPVDPPAELGAPASVEGVAREGADL